LVSWLFVLREIRERERRKCIFPKRSDIAISIAFPFVCVRELERERERERERWGFGVTFAQQVCHCNGTHQI